MCVNGGTWFGSLLLIIEQGYNVVLLGEGPPPLEADLPVDVEGLLPRGPLEADDKVPDGVEGV